MIAQSITERFNELMEIPGVSWVVYTAGLICLLLIAVYFVGLFRNMAMGISGTSPEEDLELIREIHKRDMIADEEFDKAKELIRRNLEESIVTGDDAKSQEMNVGQTQK